MRSLVVGCLLPRAPQPSRPTCPPNPLQCNLPGCTECQVLPGGFVCKQCRDGYAPVSVNRWGLFTACSPLIKASYSATRGVQAKLPGLRG